MFQPASASANLPQQEEEILRFWRASSIFDQSVEQRRQSNVGRFVFYEGPPTANGMPHPDRCLLYQGHKIVWWWAQGGTALSSGEVGQGYREVADPSVYVKFPIVYDERAKQLGLQRNTSLVVWTTTPWTLSSNMFVAANSE